MPHIEIMKSLVPTLQRTVALLNVHVRCCIEGGETAGYDHMIVYSSGCPITLHPIVLFSKQVKIAHVRRMGGGGGGGGTGK
jgi:hypothetical protein